MNVSALAKDLVEMKRQVNKVSSEIVAGRKELEDLSRGIELAKAELKNTQVLKDPLIQNYDMRVGQKKKELVILDADIKAAQETRMDLDEGMAGQIADGQQAILNLQKVERSTEVSIRNLKQIEDSVLQNIANLKASQAAESSALSSLQESVVSLKQDQDRVLNWLREKEVLIKEQENLEQREQELNKGRDYLKAWEKEVLAYEHDLKVMESRLSPAYMEAYKSINSKHIHGTTTK